VTLFHCLFVFKVSVWHNCLALVMVSPDAIIRALHDCPNTNSSPDSISYQLLKAVQSTIIQPLTIIFQHSLFEGVFPDIWKDAVVTALYKGRGLRTDPGSYRPISLCSCIGKILEKIVTSQLRAHLGSHVSHHLLHPAQHGFTSGRSTQTNLLSADACIAALVSANHAFDIIYFDFAKAFDKAPHHAVLRALSEHGVRGTALNWFASFLSGRTQRVRVGHAYSTSADVVSGVVQGSVVGPCLYTIFVDSLLRDLRCKVFCYADDIKLIFDVTKYTAADAQGEIDKVVKWADINCTPLSIDKCCVMHCGKQEVPYAYHIKAAALKCVTSVIDLGVMRSSSISHSAHYHAHYDQMVSKAARVCGWIRHCFRSRSRALLWPAFQIYVEPLLMYCSSVWSPALKRDIQLIEGIQRRYTKCISGLSENKRLSADMMIVHKCLYSQDKIQCSLADLGLSLMNANTRGGHTHLTQCHIKPAHAQYFPHRASAEWNKLNLNLTKMTSSSMFKRNLSVFLLSNQ
jgi:hypothetical protein